MEHEQDLFPELIPLDEVAGMLEPWEDIAGTFHPEEAGEVLDVDDEVVSQWVEVEPHQAIPPQGKN